MSRSNERAVELHGNDLGIWVCDANGVLIGDGHFIEAASSGDFPLFTSVKLGPPRNNRRKYFRKPVAQPLQYYDSGQILNRPVHLHLFSIGEAAAGTFMQECDLIDLELPFRMAGVVMVTEKYTVDRYGSPQFELGWVRAQNVPFVIAATGFDVPHFSIDTFRADWGLEPKIPVVIGPSMLEKNDHEFDPQHARQVLEALSEQIELDST